MQISLNLEVCRGNRVDRRKTFDSKIFYDQHNKFSVEINCYHRVRFHSIVTMVTRDVRVLNMSLSLPSATCRIYTCWSGSRRVQTPRCSFFSCHGCDVWILSCSRAILPKEKFVGFQSLLKSWRSIFLWTKSPLLSCPIATERIRSQLKYIVKYRYTDVSARTRASQIGKLLRCSDEIEIQSRIYADIRIRTYVIVSKQGLRSSEIVSPEICIYRDFNIFKLN